MMNKWFKILAALFVIGLIAAFLVFKFVYNKPHTDYSKVKPAFTLTAEELFSSFKGDKGASDTKYTGQVIEITGNVSQIEHTDSLTIAVFILEEGMFGDEGIRCTILSDYYEILSSINDGDQITIKGYCTGYNEVDIILEKCSIIN
ncbi:hypothetical protein ACFLRI_04915 [Bacteroidota bacterium]